MAGMDEDTGDIVSEDDEMYEEEELQSREHRAAATAEKARYVSPSRTSFKNKVLELIDEIRNDFDASAMDALKTALLAYNIGSTLECTNFNDLLNLILNRYPSSYRRVVTILSETVPEIHHDLAANDKLKKLSEQIRQQEARFSLDPDNDLFGRDKEFQEIMELLFPSSPDEASKVINICGLPGIGKSHLAKHIGYHLLESDYSRHVHYVDCRNVRNKRDLMVAILKGCGKEPVGTEVDLIAAVNDFLLHETDSLLVLDDLSGVLDDPVKATEFLEFIDELFDELFRLGRKRKRNQMPSHQAKRPHRHVEPSHQPQQPQTSQQSQQHQTSQQSERQLQPRAKVTFLITSQTKLEIDQENPRDLPAKSKIKDYTKDYTLKPISEKDSKAFLAADAFSQMSSSEKKQLLKKCAGHPLSLHLLNVGSTMYDSAELNELTYSDIEQSAEKLIKKLYQQAYSRLSDSQQHILLALSLYNGSAVSFETLYKTVNHKGSEKDASEFYSYLDGSFRSNFWLCILLPNDVKSESQKKKIVKTMHPSTQVFLTSKAQEQPELMRKFEDNFIDYHMNLMKTVGYEASRGSVMLCKSLLGEHRLQFVCSLKLIQSRGDLVRLFPGLDSRTEADVLGLMYLFLVFHYFYDTLEGMLLDILCTLVHNNQQETRYSVLLKTLYLMSLAVGKDWLEVKQMAVLTPPNFRLLGGIPHLYRFCQAIHYFTLAEMNSYAPWITDKSDSAIVKERKGLYDKAISLTETLTDLAYAPIRNYWRTLGKMCLAQSMRFGGDMDISTLKRAQKICAKAVVDSEMISMLKPRVFTVYADLSQLMGSKMPDLKKTAKLYEEAITHYKKVAEMYQMLDMQRSMQAAVTQLNCCVAMCNYGSRLAKSTSSQDKRHVYQLYTDAVTGFIDTSRRFVSFNCRQAKPQLLECYYWVGYSSELTQVKSEAGSEIRVRYQRQALRYYSRAYNLLKNEYRDCNISPENHYLNFLLDRFPLLLDRHGRPREVVDKARENLLAIKDMSQKEADEAMMELDEVASLSGSNCYDSSSDSLELFS